MCQRNTTLTHTLKRVRLPQAARLKGTARTTRLRDELSEYHPSRKAPKRNRHKGKNPNQKAHPEVRAASQQKRQKNQNPTKNNADQKTTRTNKYPRELCQIEQMSTLRDIIRYHYCLHVRLRPSISAGKTPAM